MAGEFPVAEYVPDTRPIHRDLFAGLGPAGHDYYVGNYRGFHKMCLRDYDVTVGDPLACSRPAMVQADISRFGMDVVDAVVAIEQALAAAPQIFGPEQNAVAVVRISCLAFVRFLTIHPYADGNGHIARSLLWIVLRHFGYIPDRWTIEPRPAIPNYLDLIAMHRRGITAPLEQFVLGSISMVS